jgi:hypothetical protein
MRSRRLVGAAQLALVLAASVPLASCTHLEFEQDRRLTFLTPPAYALTRTPVTVTWTMKGAPVAGSGQVYAVFVDQAPIKVGHTLQSLRPGLKLAQQLLNSINVYTTTAPSLTLARVPDLTNDSDKRQQHTVTVVLLDSHGVRSTESAWTRTFDLSASDAT